MTESSSKRVTASISSGVDDSVVLELKAVDQVAPIHQARLISYRRLANKRVGLLINFHSVKLTDGIIRRIV